MTPAQLKYSLPDAISRGRDPRDLLKDYQLSHCHNPQKVKVFDPYSGTFVLRDVPCGTCYHCRESLSNEWVTRMHVHSYDYPYVYFLTLTYRSFANLNGLNGLLVDYLRDALWHKDTYNTYHRNTYSPCVLVKSHYQKFLKRLRKSLPDSQLTYYMCGEYGHDFGRPHFHFVLFSKVPITYQHCRDAWSLKLAFDPQTKTFSRLRNHHGTSYLCPFGKVQLDDLVQNGTMNSNGIVVDGQTLSAKHCFSYVCKYLRKTEYNQTRIKLAYNSLFETINVVCNVNKPNQYVYEKTLFKNVDDCPLAFADTIARYLEDESSGCRFSNYDKDMYDFVRAFRPFREPSRSTAIGSLYVKNNIEQMAKGVYLGAADQAKGLVVPSYFVRKTKEYLCGLRRVSLSNSFVKGNMPAFIALLENIYYGDITNAYVLAPKTSKQLRTYLHSTFAFADVRTGVRYLVYETNSTIQAVGYRYDRSKRDYVPTITLDYRDFYHKYMPELLNDVVHHDEDEAVRLRNLQDIEDCRQYLADHGYNFDLLLCDVCDSIVSSYINKQKDYNNTKQHFD